MKGRETMRVRLGSAIRASLFIPLLGCLSSCGSCDPDDRPAVTFWFHILNSYPDLPERVQSILENNGKIEDSPDFPTAEVVIHTISGPVTVSGTSVDILATNLNSSQFKRLLEYWKTIPDRAKKLGIEARSDSRRDRILILASDGKLEIAGPKAGERQFVDICGDAFSGDFNIKIHVFGDRGKEAFSGVSATELAKRRGARGPPALSVLVIGRLKNIDVEGPADASSQDVRVETVRYYQEPSRSTNSEDRTTSEPGSVQAPEFRSPTTFEPPQTPVFREYKPIQIPTFHFDPKPFVEPYRPVFKGR